MANDVHVALLKKGVDAWHAWRRANPDIRPDLSRADLREANLWAATLVDTDLTGADLTGSRVHGVSAWRVTLDKNTKQQDLIITDENEPTITVDNIEVAQFVYLMLNNQKLR